MTQIKLMPQKLANQIAAGEVVGRPASVVKELVENCVDAGATEIKISIEKSGSQYIKVEDNGTGISKSDMKLSLQRHATSKIYSVEDLYGINSMGFRGEALASIASIARVRITSQQMESPDCWSLYVEGGDEVSFGPHPPIQGTKVEVIDLFYNTPARKRFLRKDSTEWSYIDDLIKKLALAHSHVSMTLIKDGKKSRHYPASPSWDQQTDRLRSLFGNQISAEFDYFQNKIHSMSIEGFLGRPTMTRALPDMQYIIINNRVIKDSSVAHAVKRAYQGLTYQGRHSVYVISIQVDPSAVDVNVHPTKDRVRFDQIQLVSDFVYKSVKSALSKVHHDEAKFAMSQSNTEPLSKSVINTVDVSDARHRSIDARQEELSVTMPPSQIDMKTPHSASSDFSFRKDPSYLPTGTQSTQTDGRLGFALAQIHGIYILSKSHRGYFVIDMHAAHERILLEKIKTQYQGDGVTMQNLLLPICMSLDDLEVAILLDHSAIIKQLGFEVVCLSDNQVKVNAMPRELSVEDPNKLLVDVIAELKSYDNSDQVQNQLDRIFATMTCHAAIRANRQLTIIEMNALLRQIETCTHASVCNHGRPTTLELTPDVLDKLFHRGQ